MGAAASPIPVSRPPNHRRPREEEAVIMSEQGLSIFDDEPEQSAKRDARPDQSDEETRVLPRVPAPPAAPGGRPATASSGAPLPVVRRGGYDPAAVDARLKQHAQENAGLASSLTTAQQRIAELESRLQAANDQLAENQTPSYAGLGGRASAMLRLAEEEAGEIRGTAEKDALEI